MSHHNDRSIPWGVALAGLDTICVFMAFLITAQFIRPATVSIGAQMASHVDYFVVLVGAWYFQALDQRLFVSRRGDALIPQLFSYTKAFFLAIICTIFVLALLRKTSFDRPFILVYAGLALLFMVTFRTTLRLGVWGLRRRGYSYRRILMIGANERAARAAQIIMGQRHHGFQIVGFMDDDAGRQDAFEGQEIPYLGPVKDLSDYLAREVVDVVYISLPIRSHYETIQHIAHLCEGVGVSVRLVADLFPLRIATSGLSKLSDIPLLRLTRESEIRGQTFVRRLVDMAVALILLFMLAPLLLVVYVALKIERRGPALERAEYTSPSDRNVRLLKFCTRPRNSRGGEGEVTRFGEFLERYSLDELPELVNILTGQLSYADPWRGLRPVHPRADVREA